MMDAEKNGEIDKLFVHVFVFALASPYPVTQVTLSFVFDPFPLSVLPSQHS